jgi:cation:H+ antiporter
LFHLESLDVPLSAAHDYPLWLNALIFLFSGIVVWVGGTRLTVQVDKISSLTGIGQAFAGMLLLGCITSLPEVANTITASSIGNPALGVNNLLGSAAINVFLLAIGDAFVRRDALTSIVAGPSTLMLSVLCMLVLIAVAIAITTGDVLLVGVGAWGLAITVISIIAFWLASGYGARSRWHVIDDADDAFDATTYGDKPREALGRVVWKAAGAGAAIFVAGYALSQTGDALAEQTGLGTGMVGFALIGIATSMPELSTIIESIRPRRYEMAFGQVLGTNFVNLSLFVLADAVFAGGPVVNELGRFETISALLGAALIGVFLVGLLERRDATIMRMGYDSLAVIILFFGGLGVLASIQ